MSPTRTEARQRHSHTCTQTKYATHAHWGPRSENDLNNALIYQSNRGSSNTHLEVSLGASAGAVEFHGGFPLRQLGSDEVDAGVPQGDHTHVHFADVFRVVHAHARAVYLTGVPIRIVVVRLDPIDLI